MASPIQNVVFGGGAAYVRAMGEAGQAAESRPLLQPRAASEPAKLAETVQTNRDYARLAALKEDANAVATNVRESARVLQQARELVDAMRVKSLAIIKNYPPFPPGSEERRQYLESIQALRRQMEALIYPPPQRADGGALPVEYTLPTLDSLQATDSEVAAFHQGLETLAETLVQRLAALREMVASLPDWFPDAPPLPSGEAAVDLSVMAAAQLAPPGPSLAWQGLDRMSA